MRSMNRTDQIVFLPQVAQVRIDNAIAAIKEECGAEGTQF